MLTSDRRYLAKFSVGPEMENQPGDINFYMDAEFEELTEDMALDFLFDHHRKHECDCLRSGALSKGFD